MKKTLNINICGIIFHIDEDAYNRLNNYLDLLKRHFHVNGENREIIDDIEARIAELLQEKLGPARQVITDEDVAEVIQVMGQPSQIGGEESETQAASGGAQGFRNKRFFRNPDDRILGGVCSGIGAYFHLDPLWIRILFLVLLFGGGFGLLIYLVLWVVLPEARSTAEKLEMRGEEINVVTIEKSIREEVDQLKEQFSHLSKSAKENIRRRGEASSAPVDHILKGFLEVVRFVGRVLMILLGAVLIFTGIALFIALLALLFGWGGALVTDHDFTILALPDYMRIILKCNMNPFFIELSLLMLLGVPLLMILYSGLRLMFRFDGIRNLPVTMFNIWLVGLIIAAFTSFQVYNLFKAGEVKRQEIAIRQTASDTLYLRYAPDSLLNEMETSWLPGDVPFAIDQEGRFYLLPQIQVVSSDGQDVEIVQTTRARGSKIAQARNRLAEISYNIVQRDSLFVFDPRVGIGTEACWRGQEVVVTVKVPEGKTVELGPGRWMNWIY